jgi:copper chaperone CopZ
MRQMRIAGQVFGIAAVFAVLVMSTGCRRDVATSARHAPQAQVATRIVAVPVDGMICQVCAGTVKHALESVDGVENAEISLEKRNAVIRYDIGKVTLDQLTRVIKDAGYRPGAPAPVQ